MEDYKFLFKVVLVGNAGVGKTCLVRRFTQGMFPPGQGATIGFDFMIKTVEIEGEKIKVSFLRYCRFRFLLVNIQLIEQHPVSIRTQKNGEMNIQLKKKLLHNERDRR